MGLSAFEEHSDPPPYCCPSADRSLTTRLLESSNIPSKCSSRFAHTPEWADGIDIWSSSQISPTKNEISRHHFDFHRDLGLYLPRHEKPNSAPTTLKALQINSKITTNHFPPQRIRQLLNKEKDLLLQNDLPYQQVTIDNPPLPSVPTNTFRQSTSIETSSTNEIRLPLHHTTSKSSTPPPPPPPPAPQPQPQQLNQEALKSLLKEHLTSLLTRGASTINANRSLINVPSLDIKQQIRTDSKLIEERFSKYDELNPTQQIKPNQQTSPLIFYQKSTLGLTVTPVDLSPQRNFSSISLEKMAQQRNFIPDFDTSSIVSSRSSTQPVPLPPPPTYVYQQQQRAVLKRNLDTTNSSPGDIITSNENSNKSSEQSQPIQNIRKGPSQHRSSPKNGLNRATVPATTTTIELLPPIISGKRLHIPLANHRYL